MQWGLALSGWSIPFTSHHPDRGGQICHDVFFLNEAKQRQQDLPGNWSEGYRIQLKMFLGVHVCAQKLNESWFNFSCTFSQFHSNSMSWCQPHINPNCTVWISGSCVTVWHRMLYLYTRHWSCSSVCVLILIKERTQSKLVASVGRSLIEPRQCLLPLRHLLARVDGDIKNHQVQGDGLAFNCKKAWCKGGRTCEMKLGLLSKPLF